MDYPKKKLLLIGHGRHGKDTVAEILRDYHGYSFVSSSWYAAEKIMLPAFQSRRARNQGWDKNYVTAQHCFDDRHNHRDIWFHEISSHCAEHPNALVDGILSQADMYVGMRGRDELERSGLRFDHVIWVDASNRLPPEGADSNELNEDDADIIIDNNGTKCDLWLNVYKHAISNWEFTR